MMFGLSVGMILQAIDAGEPQNRLQVMMAGVWLLMGVGDVWWLLHFGSARPLQPSSPPAPAG